MFDRKKQLRWFKLRVGIVITLALLLLFLTVFFAGSIEKLFIQTAEVKAQIKDVKGLRVGSPVWFSGIEVGSVKKITLDPACGTVVTLALNEENLPFIKKDTVASVLTIGLLGDKYIELSQGSPEAGPLQPGEVIKGATQLDMKDMLDIAMSSLKNMNSFIDKLGILVSDIEEGGGTIARLIKDPTLYENLQKTSQSLAVVMDDINKKRGTLGMLVKDPALYEKLSDSSSRLNGILQKFDTTATSVDEFTRKLNSGSGTLQRLMEDPELYENLNNSSRRLSLILEGIDRGEGTAGALLKDDEMAQELTTAIKEMKELLTNIRENPKRYFKFSLF